MTGPDDAFALVRFVQDAAAALIWGGSAYLATLVPSGLAAALDRRLAVFGRGAALALLVATVAGLPVQAATIGDGWADAADPASLQAILLGTNVGALWRVQVAVAALVLAVSFWRGPIGLPARGVVSGGMCALLGLRGHALMHAGGLGLLHQANNVLHVLAAGAWLGALPPLLLLMRAPPGQDVQLAMQRFSFAGHFAVALVVGTGVVDTALVLGRWPIRWWSAYDRLLDMKIALVAVMIGLALINRYRLVPRLAHDPGAGHRLRRNILVMVLLGFAALGSVGIFGLLEPTAAADVASMP